MGEGKTGKSERGRMEGLRKKRESQEQSKEGNEKKERKGGGDTCRYCTAKTDIEGEQVKYVDDC